MRNWFSWLKRFVGTLHCLQEDGETPLPRHAARRSRDSDSGGLDSTWTTDLKLGLMACDSRCKRRLGFENLGQEGCVL